MESMKSILQIGESIMRHIAFLFTLHIKREIV